MNTNTETIKRLEVLPNGAVVLDYKIVNGQMYVLAIVEGGDEFASWGIDVRDKSCFWGHYKPTLRQAVADFEKRGQGALVLTGMKRTYPPLRKGKKTMVKKNDNSREAYDKARKAYDKARKVRDKACEAYNKAWEVYDNSWEAYDKACKVYGKACKACDKAREACDKALEAYNREVQ